MFYSVYDWNRQAYDIFESANGEANGQRPKARRFGPGPRGPGQQLESLLPVLPVDAVKIRTSAKPAGRVAIHHSSPAVGLGEYDPTKSPLVTSPWTVIGFGAVGVYLGYSLLKHLARKL